VKRIFLLIFSFSFLSAFATETNWYGDFLQRFSQFDTVGITADLDRRLKEEKTPEGIQLARLINAEYLLITNRNEHARVLLEQYRADEPGRAVDSVHAIYLYLQGNYFFNTDNYLPAVPLLNKAIQLFGEEPRTFEHARTYHLRGTILQALEYFTDAKKDLEKAARFFHHMHDVRREASSLNNLGIVALTLADSSAASQYLLRSFSMRDSIQDLNAAGQSLNNLGELMFRMGHYGAAMDYYTNSYDYRLRGNTPQSGLIESRINIGKSLHRLGNSRAAIDTLEHALADASAIARSELQRRAAEELLGIYASLGQYEKAFAMQKIFHELSDSMYGASLKEEMARLTEADKYENREKQDSLRRAEQEIARLKVEQEEGKRNRIVIFSLIAGLLLAGFFVYTLFRSNEAKKKSNAIIRNQRDILDNKQREITESIHYARYIQQALLPDGATLGKMQEDYFIFYQPKDIVSGDFYWCQPRPDGFLLAVADCTGHGVPGAFMSLLGKENFDKASQHTSSPGEILANVNRAVRRSLHQDVSREDQTALHDGMDCALIRLAKTGNKITIAFAGANRPLWIRRKNSAAIEEIRPTKAAIAGTTPDDQVFEESQTEVFPGDVILLFTDGFADQFGGEKVKKLTTKKFRELLSSLPHTDTPSMRDEVEHFFREWKGVQEQIDDVLLIGIKIR
jgi:serine phosphatase RsbU (regulator of sigma subunit)